MKETEGFGLIQVDEGGNIFSNQAGGYACKHLEVRGRFQAISDESCESVLENYFTGDAHGGWCTDNLDIASVHVVNAVLCTLYQKRNISIPYQVNEQRLKESMEAWIWICDEFGKEAVLVWTNSD